MAEELKPCPFCGEEHVKVAYTGYENEGCVLNTIGCSTTNCPGHIAGSWRYFSRERAIEAWNTRAERTCKFVADAMNTAWDDDDNEIETGEVDDDADMSCGNCGYPMMRDACNGWWDEEKGHYGGWFLAPRFNYCPKCGSRVTDWDGRKLD